MAQRKLDGLKIAILATDGFEQSELLEPRKALQKAGATIEVVSPKRGTIRGWSEDPKIKDFAAMMVQDHSAANEKLAAAEGVKVAGM